MHAILFAALFAANDWYTGEIIESEELEYPSASPNDLDDDSQFASLGEDQENQFTELDASSRGTDDSLEAPETPTTKGDRDDSIYIPPNPSLQPFASRANLPPTEHETPIKRQTYRTPRKLEESQRRALANQ